MPTGRELRRQRTARVFTAMAADSIDVLVLGRQTNIAYATGVHGLWTAGTRPFGAGAVLCGAGRGIHALSTWDAGVPPEVPFEHCYGITWNPATMAAALGAIPGFSNARRLGVDALSPGFERAVARLAPDADVVEAAGLFDRVRAVKLAPEVDRIRAAVAIARRVVECGCAAVTAGRPSAEAEAAMVLELGRIGVTVPGAGITARVEDDGRHVIAVSVLVDYYEGAAAAVIGSFEDEARSLATLVSACRSGAGVDTVRGAAPRSSWRVRGIGMGFEWPLITSTLGADVVLARDMTLCVELGPLRAVVRVTEGEPERL